MFLRSALVALAWALPVSIAAHSIAACADSNEADALDPDAGSPLPGSDAGDAGSDAADPDVAEPPVPCAVGNLCLVTTPLELGYVVAMKGRSKDDVWASGTGGVLMHWDGQQWAALQSPTSDTLSSIFLTPTETWGVSGTLVVRRGIEMESVRQVRVFEFAYSLSGIAAISPDEVYVGYSAGPIQGATPKTLGRFTSFDTPMLGPVPQPFIPGTDKQQPMTVRALFSVPGKSLWLVGDEAAVARYPVSPLGTGVLVPVDSQASFLAVWGEGEQVWTAGTGGTILHFDGVSWRKEVSGTTETLNAIFGFSSNDLWAAGDGGTILHSDGKTWSRVDVGRYANNLRTIWGSAPDDVWIGGERAMLHWGALR